MSESLKHLDLKYDLYWKLIQNNYYVEIEKSIGQTRTDILAEVNNSLIAIEIQNTPISISTITHRMREHTKFGAYTLWLITLESISKSNNIFAHNYKWISYLQKLQQGSIFIIDSMGIKPARVDNSLNYYKGEIIAGKKKILETHNEIEIDEISLEKYKGYNTTTYLDWFPLWEN